MKRELVLMLLAGILFGFIAGWIVREKTMGDGGPGGAPAAAPGQGQPPAPGVPGGSPPFDPDQHSSMIQQFMEKAKEPGDIQSKVMLGNIYYDRGNFQEAATWYEGALKLDDKDPNVLVDLGVCYKNMGRPSDALASFDRALALEKDKKEALFNKVVVYAFDLKDGAKADAALKRLKEVAPGDPRVAELEAELKRGK